MTQFELEAKELLLQILDDINDRENTRSFYERMDANADSIVTFLEKYRIKDITHIAM